MNAHFLQKSFGNRLGTSLSITNELTRNTFHNQRSRPNCSGSCIRPIRIGRLDVGQPPIPKGRTKPLGKVVEKQYSNMSGWLDSVSSRIVYELYYRNLKLVLNLVSIHLKVKYSEKTACCSGRRHCVTGTIPHHLSNVFSSAPGDRKQGSVDGCRMWFVNS